MTTPKPGIDLSSLHPVMQQALAPFVSRYHYQGVNYYDLQDMQEAMQRERYALDEQMQRENARTNFGATL